MRTREDVIKFCMGFYNVYEDYPFSDTNWTLMRHKENKKMFVSICEHLGNIWVNVKCDPDITYMWRSEFKSVVPAYHMNKWHWNSIILDGTVDTEAIKAMISDSYELTNTKLKKKK